jgi:alpha-beta hydrolase superfamily lysophospholipase
MSTRATAQLFVGWHELLTDVSLNFQLNRWAAYGGPAWLDEVRPILPQLRDYDSWRDTFVDLGERATSQGHPLFAALHLRCAEFFMTPEDPRKEPIRQRMLRFFQVATGVPKASRREVEYGPWRLPTWHFRAEKARGTCVIFGGFDSYIEEFFPIFSRIRELGYSVVAFEGPGQGSVLEEQRVPMTPDWHLPVRAVLDAYDLDDVTLIGISLGGCLAIRAAAYEPRVHRVVAFDALTDFFDTMLSQLPWAPVPVVSALQSVTPRSLTNRALREVGKRRPVAEWGLRQAMHVFGCAEPADALRAAKSYHTRDVSPLVVQDTLILGGSHDHYVPTRQVWEQGQRLTHARSVTVRMFSREEHAQAHCQVGNLPLAIDVITSWIDDHTGARAS